MAPYIYTTHKKLHIINLQKSSERYTEAAKFIEKLVSNNGKIMFIGTKRAASDIVKKYSDMTSMPYVNNRWLGGLLTNFNTIKKVYLNLRTLEINLRIKRFINFQKSKLLI